MQQCLSTFLLNKLWLNACRCYTAWSVLQEPVTVVVPNPRSRIPKFVNWWPDYILGSSCTEFNCDTDWSVPHVHTLCVHLHNPVIIKYRSLHYSCSSLWCRCSTHYFDSKFGMSRFVCVKVEPTLPRVCEVFDRNGWEPLNWRIKILSPVWSLTRTRNSVWRKCCQLSCSFIPVFQTKSNLQVAVVDIHKMVYIKFNVTNLTVFFTN